MCTLVLLAYGLALGRNAEGQEAPTVGPPVVNPAAITVGAKTAVRFSIEVHDERLKKVLLERLVGGGFKSLGRLKDKGKRGDTNGGDGFYTKVKKLKYESPGLQWFRLVGKFEVAPRQLLSVASELFAVEVTDVGIPNSAAASDMSNITLDPDFDEIICDEVLVEFAEGIDAPEAIAALAPFGEVVGRIPALGVYQLRLVDRCLPGAVSSARVAISALPNVVATTPNGLAIAEVEIANNPDPKLGDQWYLDAVRVGEVWDECTKGSRLMTIGVVDTGIQYDHPDLGLFVSGGRVKPGGSFTFTFGYNAVGDPVDAHGHGTAVAGIVGAKTGNGLCVAGMTWTNPLLAVKVETTAAGKNTFFAVIQAIYSAIDFDAKVINVSIGDEACPNALTALLNPYKTVVKYAHSKDRLVVAAAGNTDCSRQPRTAGGVDEALTVGASNRNGTARWSYGSWVDVYAPGEDISLLQLGGGCDTAGSGSSFSAPIVSGAAALLWSLNPKWKPQVIRDALVATAVGNPPVVDVAAAVASLRPGTETDCHDGVDNDCDGLTDGADSNCQAGTGFVDNGNGTITDSQTGLTWEKKDQAGGLHDVNAFYPWAGLCCTGSCNGTEPLCQPNAAAASACSAASGGALGCSQCSVGSCNVVPFGGAVTTTIWDWLVQLNGSNFGGHSDWRVPTLRQDAGSAELETILASPFPCGTNPCVPAVFNTGCAVGCSVAGCSCTASSTYWSATTYAAAQQAAWRLYFGNGFVEVVEKYSRDGVRAVR